MSVMQDVRYAIRLFVKRPGFSLIAILTLGLGIGAATSMFTVIDAVLLRPLPYRAAERLVEVRITGRDGADFPLPEADFLQWRSHNDTADYVAVFDVGSVNVTGTGEPERLAGSIVSDQFFRVLDASPQLGRVFEDGEDRPGKPRVAVISHALWMRRFGGRPDAIGRVVAVAGTPTTIVGVMPAGFAFPRADVELWELAELNPSRRGPFYLTGLARLKEGVTIARFRANLDRVSKAIMRQYPAPEDWRLTAMPLHEATVGGIQRTLLVLFGTVSVLLLIATVNVASLLLARAATRDREMAVRGALGAGPRRLLAQLITESVVLSIASGAAGFMLAAWATRALLALAPDDIPRVSEVHMNGTVFAFAFAVAALAGTLFGLAPALRATTTPLVDSLKEGGRGGTSGARLRRIQQVLIVAEIALALMLTIGAGLMVRSLAALEGVEPGFEPSRLLTFRLDLPDTSYDEAKTRTFYETLLQRLEALPGVRGAGLTVSLPPHLLTMTDNFVVEGQSLPSNQSAPVGPLLLVTPNYFRVLGTPLLRGRFFTERDDEAATRVAIVDDTLAQRYFPGVDPVGRHIKQGGSERPNNPWMTIVGVVKEVKYDGLDAPPEPTFYMPFRQNTLTTQYVVIGTNGDPAALAGAARKVVASLAPDVPIANVKTMNQLIAESVAPPRFRATLVALFAMFGLMLAAIGIYGVMAYAVSERTHELGVRLALGATAHDVVRLVLAESMTLTALGIVVGIAGALATTRLLGSLLYGVTPTDLPTFCGVAAVLVATAMLASWIPVRRATRVDPMIALRDQ